MTASTPKTTEPSDAIHGTIGRKNLVARLFDQGLWSGAFFALNLVAATLLDVADFASVTVCTSIGAIAAAAIRAFAVDGRVIAGARNDLSPAESVERKSVVTSGLIGAAAASALSSCWLLAGGALTASNWWLPLLAGALVLADGSHYATIMYGLYARAAATAGAYLVVASAVVVLSLFGTKVTIELAWILALLLVWLVGTWTSRSLPWTNRPFRKFDVTLRLSGESLYSAVGAQFGILVIFLTSPPDDTAGIRLAYSLVFAPFFMFYQGLSPLLLSKMAELNGTLRRGQLSLLQKWVSTSVIGVVASALIGALLASTVLVGSNFTSVLPFLVPVGAAMIGSVFIDSAMLLLRFTADPKRLHMLRLSTVTVEAVLQLLSAIIWGTSGLVAALILGSAIKIFLGVVLYIKNRAAPPSRCDAAKS